MADPRRGAGRRRPRDRRSRSRLIAGFIVVGLVAAGAGVLSFRPDDDPIDTAFTSPTTAATTVTTEPVELTGDAEELAGLLSLREATRYHARYEATSAGGENVTIETWQDPPQARQDSEVTSGGQVVRTRVLVDDASQIQCVALAAEEWQCRQAAAGETASDPIVAMQQRLGEGTVSARDDIVDDRAVRCFTLAATEDDGSVSEAELCALPASGIPVRVISGGSTLRLVELDETIPADVFEPPAIVAD
jgi:hypothetical protein